MRPQFLFIRMVLVILASACISGLFSRASSATEPLWIGFGISLTGPLAVNRKSALVAMKIWQEDINTVVVHSDKLFIELFWLTINCEFKYSKYFSMVPLGSTPKIAGSDAFFWRRNGAKSKAKDNSNYSD